MSYPDGDYTPFGYLRNPAHRASGRWERLEGGNLRTADETVGMEWAYPWHRGTSAHAGVSITCGVGDRECLSRTDFEAIGYTSRYHSANIMGFDWAVSGVQIAARFFLADDVLCLHMQAVNRVASRQALTIGIAGRAGAQGAQVTAWDDGDGASFETESEEMPRVHALLVSPSAEERAPVPAGFPTVFGERATEHRILLEVSPGGAATVVAAMGRGDTRDAALANARRVLPRVGAELERALEYDEAFYATCPTLAGDWPANWREGFVYDFETTRMCVMPAGGIFSDVWPSWMVGWPRVVVAEGTLDMARLAYADPQTAERALLTLFRDAPEYNVPCVFQDGSPNMVASDGSVCGTSPAWCLPFLNLEQVYLRSLDRAWLTEIYPHLCHYVEWWLEHRVDDEGGVVYKCTWEAGEDGNRRLDPTGSGDADISQRIRPVELQASMAYAARALEFFARELGRESDARRWLIVAERYRERTRSMFDPESGRFRDWLLQESRFQDDQQTESYWGSSTTRFSALSLTPALGGIASREQMSALSREVREHAMPPWTIWPSWCHVLTECAVAVGLYELAGSIAANVIDGVYRQTNRRSLNAIRRPTPGVAPEYWPSDLHDWDASDAYGWGATTAQLLIRHICGLRESRDTGGWVLELTPSFMERLQQPGARFVLRRFAYRGQLLDLAFTWNGPFIDLEIELAELRHCSVTAVDPVDELVYQSRRPLQHHELRLNNCRRHILRLH